jgi:hypothetical protein
MCGALLGKLISGKPKESGGSHVIGRYEIGRDSTICLRPRIRAKPIACTTASHHARVVLFQAAISFTTTHQRRHSQSYRSKRPLVTRKHKTSPLYNPVINHFDRSRFFHFHQRNSAGTFQLFTREPRTARPRLRLQPPASLRFRLFKKRRQGTERGDSGRSAGSASNDSRGMTLRNTRG